MIDMSDNQNLPIAYPQIPKGETFQATYAGYTNIGGRNEDQDCMATTYKNGRLVFTVCDGMGGHAGGCVASLTAVKTLTDSFERQAAVIPTKEAVITAINDANRAVYEKAQAEPSLRNMGTTLTLLVIDNNAAYVAHVGDSRVYQLRKGRKIFRTNDHSQVFELLKMAELASEEEARTHRRSNILSKALGIMPDVEPTMEKISYKAGDRFVLCCDGVWNCQPEPDIIAMLTSSPSIETVVSNTETTVEKIGREKGGMHDNHTMIVVDMKVDSKYKESFIRRLVKWFRKQKDRIVWRIRRMKK